MEDIYYNHPKVQEARRLLAEAYQDIRQQRRDEANALKCRCAHRHDEHHPAYSHNYTAGSCRIKGCRCLHFLIAEVQ
jgi:hypothetical protein